MGLALYLPKRVRGVKGRGKGGRERGERYGEVLFQVFLTAARSVKVWTINEKHLRFFVTDVYYVCLLKPTLPKIVNNSVSQFIIRYLTIQVPSRLISASELITPWLVTFGE